MKAFFESKFPIAHFFQLSWSTVFNVALEVIIILCELLSVTKSDAQIDFHIMLEIRIAMPIICSFDITDQKNLPFLFKNEALSCLKELKGISMQSQKLPIAKQNGIEFCDNGLPSLFQMETFLLQNSSTYVEFFSWNSIHYLHQLEFIL